jgi:lipopolysaccharide biosynthesis protein
MKRIALFAHFDRDGIVDNYVIYYLRGLARVADRILFVSDCELRAGEAAKLEGLAELISAGRHGEYDFGSWKRGLAHLNYDLAAWDELILANDSCYAPVFPFEDVFERMSSAGCDFWSPSNNQIKGKFDHLSSYFLVFRHPVLEDKDFLSFWEHIGPQPNAGAVIAKYERGLSWLLCEKGYRYGSSLPPAEIASFLKTGYVENYLIQYKSSWLKVRLLRDNPLRALSVGSALAKAEKFYPRDLIDAHIMRMTGTVKPVHYDYRYIGTYERGFGPFALKSKIKRNKKRPRARSLWKVHLQLFRLTVFAFSWPLKA